MKILFFVGSLRAGGKERRLVELLSYLKNTQRYKLLVILTYNVIEYDSFYKLDIKFISLNKRPGKADIAVFKRFDAICRNYKPDVIHTWGDLQTLYSIPTSAFRRIPIVNSQITNAGPRETKWSFNKLANLVNFYFSDIITANSFAGLRGYKLSTSKKSQVIYNGINKNRFVNLDNPEIVKCHYNIKTKYNVIMSASVSKTKNHRLFIKIANYVTQTRKDIGFIIAGSSYKAEAAYKECKSLAQENSNIYFLGNVIEIEALVNSCEIGVLFSPYGEGISNSILEYMALGKPVVANDRGGTKELVKNGLNGILITTETTEQIGDIIINLINNPNTRKEMGKMGKRIAKENFNLEKMGKLFELAYKKACGE